MSTCKNYNEEVKCQECPLGDGTGDGKGQRIPECYRGESILDFMHKIAVVGSQASKWGDKQRAAAKAFIRDLYTRLIEAHCKVVISGGCPKGGVDIWAENLIEFDMEFKEKLTIIVFPPEVHQWEDQGGQKGYKSRNLRIARMCDVLYDLEPEGRRSGGTWTAEKVEEMGKEVHYIWFGVDGNVEERTIEKKEKDGKDDKTTQEKI